MGRADDRRRRQLDRLPPRRDALRDALRPQRRPDQDRVSLRPRRPPRPRPTLTLLSLSEIQARGEPRGGADARRGEP